MNTADLNAITLMDGTVLQGYPKSEPSAPIDNAMQLDTTGRYMTVGGKKPKPLPAIPDDVKALQELFLQNAFLFLYHREAILSDSRLFLTPLPFRSGLAYVGEGGFRRPTLGVYIEWWLNCPSSILQGPDRKAGLVYSLSGSPLSGSNSCGVVRVEGEARHEQILDFNAAWVSLMEINRQYDKAKEQYQAYTLAEAVEVVKALPPRVIPQEYDLQMLLMRHEIAYLKEQRDRDAKYAIDQAHKITQLTVEAHYDALKTLYLEYLEALHRAEKEIADAYEQRIALRKLLKEGKISNKEHQQRLQPYSKIINEKLLDVESEYYHRIYEISSDLNLRTLREYFTEHPIS